MFVGERDVPSDNNAPGWILRHRAISCQIAGGTRSQYVTDTKMILASLFGNWCGLRTP